MRKYIVTFFLFFLFINLAFASGDYIPGEVIVKFKSPIISMPEGKVKALSHEIFTEVPYIHNLNKKYGLTKAEKAFIHLDTSPGKKFIKGRFVEMPDFRNIYRLFFPEDIDVEKVAKEFEKDPNVEYASPNPIRRIFLTPNDPKYVDYPASENQWGLFRISAEAAWDYETGSDEVIAVIDTGVRGTHEDLSGKVLAGYDFVNNDADPSDDHGHGTHVAGIIGAITNNNLGIAGIDWNCKILPVKVFDRFGNGSALLSSYGITYAATMGADVINMSYGGTRRYSWEENAVKLAHDTYGCVLVAASGNDGIPLKYYPAAFVTEVIAVAATATNDVKALYSNYGDWIDISAPGGNGKGYPANTYIRSLYYMSDSNYVWMSGTSQAAPHVSGLAGLLRAQNPSWTNDDIELRIEGTADPIDSLNPGYAGKLGTGRINAHSALGGGLLARIYSPYQGGIIYGSISITGSATGEGFSFYRVSTGEGANPVVWTDIFYNTESKLNEPLAPWDTTGLTGLYSIRVRVNDLPTTEAEVIVNVGSPYGVTIVGSPLNGPNPFSPLRESTIIYYKLSANANVRLYIFDINGQLVWRRSFAAGLEEGGKQGENRVLWNGFTDFNEIASNGIYIYKIVVGDNVIGKGKIIVLK